MTLRRGASGQPVRALQVRLRELGVYAGPVDGKFGQSTYEAVCELQEPAGLDVDGVVGPHTWRLLFSDSMPHEKWLLTRPLIDRCVALSGSFETSYYPPECYSHMAGDFDGQGLSFGVLQWNLGQGTLQPLLSRMIALHRGVCQSVFGEHLPGLEALLERPVLQHLSFARAIQDRRFTIVEPWRSMLRALGQTRECRNLQTELAASTFKQAVGLASGYGLQSQRGVALLFDILVQNGSIGARTDVAIRAELAKMDGKPGPAREVVRMRIIALCRAAASSLRFAADVRARKLTIAEGVGIVHGLEYDLESQFGLTLEPAAEVIQPAA